MGTRQSNPSSARHQSGNLLGRARHARQSLANLQGQLQKRSEELALVRQQCAVLTQAVAAQTTQVRTLHDGIRETWRQMRRTSITRAATVIGGRPVGEQPPSGDHSETAFIARVSHELRTPLHSMLALLHLLLDERVGPLSAEQRKYLEVINRNGQGLLRLADDVLDRSLLATGALSMDVRATDVRDAIRAVAVNLEPLAEAKKLNLIVDVPAALPAAFCDGRRLEQVLTNLVGNAIKFTEAGSVAMTADAGGTTVNIHVTDTGIGIPSAARERIFDDFFQAHAQHRRQGSGLGLAIARNLTQQMDGRLSVDSPDGEGSRFTISLPIDQKGAHGTDEKGAHGTHEEGAHGTHTPG